MSIKPNLSDYKLIILDMDLTITIPKREDFYSQYGDKVVEAISDYFDVSKVMALDIATFYRQQCGGGEHALYDGDAHHHFDVANKPANYSLLHQKISEIDPTGEFINQAVLKPYIQRLRRSGTTVVVLTSSPDILARKTLVESGFDPENDFDAVFGYKADIGPTKITQGSKAFISVMRKFNCAASETLCIGDSIRHDVDPALAIGVDAYLISSSPLNGYKTVPNLETLLKKQQKETKTMTIIIDTDAGHDDALAMLMMMAHCPNDILCFTGVAGNATVDKVARNITAVQHMAKHDHIPMHTGAPTPLKQELVTANCHGESGLDGLDMSNVQYNQDGLAPQKIVDLANKHSGELTILTLGPLSNVARALQLDPTIETKIKQVVIMGGAIDVAGNQNRTAEFNIFVDPDAADIVFRSSIPKVLIPLDPCNDIIIPIDAFEKLKGHRLYDDMVSLMQHFISGIELEIGVKGALVYDALAAYYLIAPDAFTLKEMDVVVETDGKYTLGMTVAEKRKNASLNNNIQVVTLIDSCRFNKDMIRLLQCL